MKRGKKIILMLAALAAVLLACILVINLVPKETEVQEEEADVVICSIQSSEIAALSWDMDGEEISFSHDEDAWIYTEDEAFPTDGDQLDTMADVLSEITSSKTIDEPEDLSEYGLDEPWKQLTVTIASAGDDEADEAGEAEMEAAEADEDADTAETFARDDMKTITLSFGNTSSLTGDVYCSIGDGNVYLVDSSIPESFEYELLDLVETEAVPAMNDIESITVDSVTETLNIEYHPDEGLAYSDEYVWFENSEKSVAAEKTVDDTVEKSVAAEKSAEETKTKDVTLNALDTELTETYIDNIRDLTLAECAAYNADEQALAQYGLDDPDVEVSVEYLTTIQIETNETDEDGDTIYTEEELENTFELLLGKGEDGNCYVKLKDSSMVYTADSSLYEALAYTTFNELQPDEVLLMNWDEVDAVDIILDGETYSIEKVTREVVAEAETEEAEVDAEEDTEAGEAEADAEGDADAEDDAAVEEAAEAEVEEAEADAEGDAAAEEDAEAEDDTEEVEAAEADAEDDAEAEAEDEVEADAEAGEADAGAADDDDIEEEADDSEDIEEIEYETVWLLDGEVIELDSILDQITSMESSGYARSQEPEYDVEVTFVIYRSSNENFPQVELSFYGYDSTSCLVQRDGVSTVLAVREELVSLTEELKAMLVY